MKHSVYALKLLVVSLIVLVLMASCGGSSSFSRPNQGYLYDFKSLAPRPNYIVHHKDVDTTRIYYRLNSNELLYQRAVNETQYKADYTINYRLLKSFDAKEASDSASLKLTDLEKDPTGKIIFGFFDVVVNPSLQTKNLVLEVEITDNHRGLSFSNYLTLQRSSKNTAQHYLLTDTLGTPLFKNHIPVNTPFRLQQPNGNQSFVSLYKRNFPYALPPYSTPSDETFELLPDTTFLIKTDTTLLITEEGFYFFRSDTTKWEGYTLFSFYPQFPYIAKNVHMAEPMRYITTKREYESLVESKNEPQKLQSEINEFWLNRTGSTERSKQLLAAYYNRVEEANLLFSSYLEGWKTDRGILYIVYGAPDKVFRFVDREIWIYGEENSSLSYYFTFEKLNNPFSDNDFQLKRNSAYRYGWGQAVEAWRNGKVYSSRDIQQEQNESDQRTRAQQRAPYWY